MRALTLLVTILAAGCLRTAAYNCEQPTDCVRDGVQGSCESTGFCSFPDSACATGFRYGDLSGSYSNKCVGDGSPNDEDGDGVLDATDNCPMVANATQSNEDNDALGDACDPCPPLADNTDTDADGVGDQCDPNPATAGDTILAFEGFSAGVPAGADVQGTFTASNGEIESQATGSWRMTLPVPASATTGRETITASATLVAGGGNLQAFGVVHHQTAGMSSGVGCTVFRVSGNNGVSVANLANLQQTDTSNYEFMLGETYRFQLDRNLDAYVCRATRGSTTGTANRGFTGINPAMPSFGLVGSNATARYAWLMLVNSP